MAATTKATLPMVFQYRARLLREGSIQACLSKDTSRSKEDNTRNDDIYDDLSYSGTDESLAIALT